MEREQQVLPRFLRELLGQIDDRDRLEELRLREGYPPAAVSEGKEWVPSPWREYVLTEEELRRVLETAGGGSVHTILDQLRSGYVTALGGIRVGICGEGAMQEGKLLSFRRVTSLSVRFPHVVSGVAVPLIPSLLEGGRLQSTLILSPPGMGKTTFLRDVIACVSRGEGMAPLRVGVADERGELGGGDLRHHLGPRADVLEHCPKGMALMMLLRGMNPQVLAADEITAPADVSAMTEAAGCGVTLLATAHGSSLKELSVRPVYRELLAQKIFRRFVFIGIQNGKRIYRVQKEDGTCMYGQGNF